MIDPFDLYYTVDCDLSYGPHLCMILSSGPSVVSDWILRPRKVTGLNGAIYSYAGFFLQSAQAQQPDNCREYRSSGGLEAIETDFTSICCGDS